MAALAPRCAQPILHPVSCRSARWRFRCLLPLAVVKCTPLYVVNSLCRLLLLPLPVVKCTPVYVINSLCRLLPLAVVKCTPL